MIAAVLALGASARADPIGDVAAYAHQGTIPTQYEHMAAKLVNAKVCGYLYVAIEQNKVGAGWSDVLGQQMGLARPIQPCTFPKEANGKWAATVAAYKKTRKLAERVIVEDVAGDWTYRRNAAGQVTSRDVTVRVYAKEYTIKSFCGVEDPNVVCEQSNDLNRIAIGLNEAHYRKAEGEKLRSHDLRVDPNNRFALSPGATCQVVAYRMVGVARYAMEEIASAKRKSRWDAKLRFQLRDGSIKTGDEVEQMLTQAETDGIALFKDCGGTIELPKQLPVW